MITTVCGEKLRLKHILYVKWVWTISNTVPEWRQFAVTLDDDDDDSASEWSLMYLCRNMCQMRGWSPPSSPSPSLHVG